MRLTPVVCHDCYLYPLQEKSIIRYLQGQGQSLVSPQVCLARGAFGEDGEVILEVYFLKKEDKSILL